MPCDPSSVQSLQSHFEKTGQRCVVFRRNRPMHPGRFLAFARQHFGPLENDAQLAQRLSGWRSALRCARRRPQGVGPSVDGGDADNAGGVTMAPLLPSLPRTATFGRCPVGMASGCIWFAGSDDRQADWHFSARGAREKDWHSLLCGSPWPEEGGDEGSAAGTRRVELTFALGTTEATHIEAADDLDEEALHAAEACLRSELEACLLKRAEAQVLDSNDQALDGLAEWEAMRTLPSTQSSSALWILDLMVNVVSAVPGSGRAAALGEAIAGRTLRALGGAPGSPGHEQYQDGG